MAEPRYDRNFEWSYNKRINAVITDIQSSVRANVTRAVTFVREKVRENISVDVEVNEVSKGRGKKRERIVTRRSKPGEFPRRDTGKLWRNIEGFVEKDSQGNYQGTVGVSTYVPYARKLELFMDRAFISRTMEDPEVQNKIIELMTNIKLKKTKKK